MSASKKQPNLIMLVADDLGECDIHCYGNQIAVTPNIDRLAVGGMRLTHHYSASPMCAPARAGLLTGLYPHRTGAIDVPCVRGMNRVDPQTMTLPRLLQGLGYHTALIGKWHNGGGAPCFHPSFYGYDEFYGFEGGLSPYFDYTLERSFGDYEHITTEYITDRLTDEAIDFVKRNQERPFHLQLAYNAPHRPLEAPEEDVALFEHCDDLTKGLKILYAMIHRMDQNIGRLIDALDEAGIRENTLLLFVSDNGPDFVGRDEMAICNRPYHPYHGYKGDVLDGGIRVPAILNWPGVIPENSINTQPSIFMDWLPTFCYLAGMPPEHTAQYALDGQNLWPLLKENTETKADYFWHWTRYKIINHSNMAVYHNGYKLYYPVFGNDNTYHKPDVGYAICEGTYKIFTDDVPRDIPPKNIQPMLFYLPDDPKEEHDLYSTEKEKADELERLLQNWHQSVLKDYQRAASKTLTND